MREGITTSIMALSVGIVFLLVVLVVEWDGIRAGMINIISMLAIVGAGAIMAYVVIKLRKFL